MQSVGLIRTQTRRFRTDISFLRALQAKKPIRESKLDRINELMERFSNQFKG